MKVTTHNVRNDPPPAESEIEISPGNTAQAPSRIAKSSAVPALAKAADELAAFDQEAAAHRAELERKRAAAVDVQNHYTDLTTQRDALPHLIAKAQSELKTCQDRMVWLDQYVEEHWQEGRTHDHIGEHLRQEFLADRLPGWIEKYTARLAALDEEIAAFRKKHAF